MVHCRTKIIRRGSIRVPKFGSTTVDNNEVFVADYDNDRIVVFSLDIKFIRELGNIKSRDVKVNNNKKFVADHSKHRNTYICIF